MEERAERLDNLVRGLLALVRPALLLFRPQLPSESNSYLLVLSTYSTKIRDTLVLKAAAHHPPTLSPVQSPTSRSFVTLPLKVLY